MTTRADVERDAHIKGIHLALERIVIFLEQISGSLDRLERNYTEREDD
jgi:hypothetical protein